MSTKSSFGIAKRLHAVALCLSLGLSGVAVYAYFNLNTVATLADRTRAIRVPQLQRVAALELNVTRVSLQLRHAMLARTPDEMAASLADIGEKRKLLDTTLADYAKEVRTPADRVLLDRTTPLIAKFWELGTANTQLIEGGQKAEAFAFLVDKTIPARNELLGVLAETVKAQNERLGDDIHTVESQTQRTLAVLLALVVSSIAALGVFSWYVASLLQRRVSLARTVAEQVRDGNLAAVVKDDAHDEFSPLLAALGEMQSSLARVVSDVRVNAESVSTASTQIAHGNQDLSQRTEKQASALQQTSATMEELGVTVTHNADSARHASQLAQSASAVAAKGGEVVGQVVETMKGINDSSKQIADIIGVIDGIAFQTNILSLNAAVEAARAGEQGRGFAVVASEVRSLAQRSAEAARQIKGLITDSVVRVEHGTALVGRAGETMTEIVEAIKSVSHIVTEISAASAQQSAGVSQVCQAVTQMDEATQQNAALVEQSAAAAESLKSQAMELVRAVAVFRIAAGNGKAATAVKNTSRQPPAPTTSKAPTPSPAATRAPQAAVQPDTEWATF